LIDTCFATHHLQFAFDDDNTLWTSAGGPQNAVVGWLNTKKFLATGDAAASQGWTALVLDTNGNGKRDDYVVPNQPVDPQKGKRIVAALYGTPSARPTARSGAPHWAFRVLSCISRAPTRRRLRLPNITRYRGMIRRRQCTAIRRAAWTSTKMASYGCRWQTAILPVSTVRNARGC
jgi:hypothetical protein